MDWGITAISSEEHILAKTCFTCESNIARLDIVKPGEVWKGNQIEFSIMRRIWEIRILRQRECVDGRESVHRCVRFQKHGKVVEKNQEIWQSEDVQIVYKIQAGISEMLRA
jgi:hypothetical protein